MSLQPPLVPARPGRLERGAMLRAKSCSHKQKEAELSRQFGAPP
jgi:hypothetical protein